MTKPARNLPPRSDSITIITRAQPRNQNISPDRLKLEAVLTAATTPLRVDALAKLTGIEPQRVRKLLQSLRQDGFASNVAGSEDPRWRARVNSVAPSIKRPKRVANGNQPKAKPGYLPSMTCVRPGAEDHRMIPSREGDKLKAYRAPASMVSA